jgi:hypothetical protein
MQARPARGGDRAQRHPADAGTAMPSRHESLSFGDSIEILANMIYFLRLPPSEIVLKQLASLLVTLRVFDSGV